MFGGRPSYSPYRPLRLREPLMVGEDVFALQTGINSVNESAIAADGAFGPKTRDALIAAQRKVGTVDDGICGPDCWRKLVDKVAQRYRVTHRIAIGALYGQIESESSFRGGSYSLLYEATGTWDVGVCQINSGRLANQGKPLSFGFDMPKAINYLAADNAAFYSLFAGVETRRRWNLAQGAWNRPAYACWYARQEGGTDVPASKTRDPRKDGQGAVDAFNEYLANVGAYLRV